MVSSRVTFTRLLSSVSCECELCLGRVERLGYKVPLFDFRLPGVTSMSADIHKYGLGIKVCVVPGSIPSQSLMI